MSDDNGVVVFSFDHAGNPDIAGFVLDEFIKRDIKATLYVQTGLIGAKRWNSKQAHLDRLYEHGWDLGSHTVTHASLGFLNEEAVEYEIRKSTQDLLNFGYIRSAAHFSYPQSSHSEITLKVVKKYCKTARMVTGKLGPLKPVEDGYYMLDCISMKANDPPIKAIEFIKRAALEKKVAHIMFEMIFLQSPPPQGYLYDYFIEILDTAYRMKLNNEIRIMLVSELYQN